MELVNFDRPHENVRKSNVSSILKIRLNTTASNSGRASSSAGHPEGIKKKLNLGRVPPWKFQKMGPLVLQDGKDVQG